MEVLSHASHKLAKKLHVRAEDHPSSGVEILEFHVWFCEGEKKGNKVNKESFLYSPNHPQVGPSRNCPVFLQTHGCESRLSEMKKTSTDLNSLISLPFTKACREF